MLLAQACSGRCPKAYIFLLIKRHRKFSGFSTFKRVRIILIYGATMKRLNIILPLFVLIAAAAFLAGCADMQTSDRDSGYVNYNGHGGHGGHH